MTPTLKANSNHWFKLISLKEDEKGVVSSIFVVENLEGDKEINVLLRDQRSPIVGDKFASRHGQKGVIGGMFKQSDMPFTENGMVPDLIMNPHSIPSRMTVGQWINQAARPETIQQLNNSTIQQ
jgi:DNA-directed RNA polymerase beta subunit